MDMLKMFPIYGELLPTKKVNVTAYCFGYNIQPAIRQKAAGKQPASWGRE